MTRQSKFTEQTVTIDVDFITETDKAYLVSVLPPGKKKEEKVWLPKSMVQYHQKGLVQEVEMPESYALEKGLI